MLNIKQKSNKNNREDKAEESEKRLGNNNNNDDENSKIHLKFKISEMTTDKLIWEKMKIEVKSKQKSTIQKMKGRKRIFE